MLSIYNHKIQTVQKWPGDFSHNFHRLPLLRLRREKGDRWALKIERKLKEILRRK